MTRFQALLKRFGEPVSFQSAICNLQSAIQNLCSEVIFELIESPKIYG